MLCYKLRTRNTRTYGHTRAMGWRDAWPVLTDDEIRRRSRILVIDDQDFPYKKTFTADGYTVEKWADVKRLPDLENGQYDLILLDLQGVGRSQSADEGLGVLQHLRLVAPAQIVIAYSNAANFSLKDEPFFRLADAVLHKTADYVDFKREVDRLLRRRFSINFYVERVAAQLGEQAEDIPRLSRKTRSAILSCSPDKLEHFLRRRTPIDNPNIDRAIKVAQVGVAVMKLWHQT